MQILFVHQNFPGQFKFLAPALVREGHEVTAFTMQKMAREVWHGVKMKVYGVGRGSTVGIHPWVCDFETKTIRGEACFRAALRLKAEGYLPDVIIAHPGWGESLFLKDVWPFAKLGIYCEFYYRLHGADVGFDPEFSILDEGDGCRLRLKNLNYMLHFEGCDAGISPTLWQAGTFPEAFRSIITVVHDGIDTDVLTPNSAVRVKLNGNLTLTKQDEVITFVNRNLEPCRGYHIFMRALPELLRLRKNAIVLIVGGDAISYGVRSDGGRSWKEIFTCEVRPMICDADWARVFFLGNIPYGNFISLLQLSTVHVYLTYPFVLSWSLLEAMSVGCAVVASDTSPLHEALLHNETGRLVNFFDVPGLVAEVCNLLDDQPERVRLGTNARVFAQEHYDLKCVCMPRQLAWVKELAGAL